jgi:hypothetical protein
MKNMPGMLAYSVKGGIIANDFPNVVVGQGASIVNFKPTNSQNDTYWIAIIDSMNPTTLVQQFLVPGQNNSSVPTGLDSYMTNPQYLFAVVTQQLSSIHVPQGAWYNYLVQYGAGEQLQMLEQLNTTIGCGAYGWVSYLLTGPCGPRTIGNPSYEIGSFNDAAILMMSLMPQPNGKGPYVLVDSYTFIT